MTECQGCGKYCGCRVSDPCVCARLCPACQRIEDSRRERDHRKRKATA
jgi:hypothetical protein